MTKSKDRTRIAEDGLRYQKKTAGSSFGNLGNHTRSCWRCGKRRGAGGMKALRLLGRVEMVCAPSCDAE